MADELTKDIVKEQLNTPFNVYPKKKKKKDIEKYSEFEKILWKLGNKFLLLKETS